MLLPMAKVQIMGAKACQDETVQVLCRLGAVQVDDWNEKRALTQRRMALTDNDTSLRQRLTYAATQVESVLVALPVSAVSPGAAYEEWYDCPLDWLIQAVEADLDEVGPGTRALATRRNQLDEEASSLIRYESAAQQLMPLVPALVDLERFAVAAVWVERRYRETLELVAQRLEELTGGQCEVISREVDRDVWAALLVFPKADAHAVNELLGRESITQIHLPTELAGQPFDKALANMHRRLQAIPAERVELEARQAALAQKWRARLQAWQILLRDQLARIDVQASFGQTDYTFIIEGWVLERDLPAIEGSLEREVGGAVLLIRLPISLEEQESAPVMFGNPPLVKPFEPLVRLLALPKSGAFDPTPLMSIVMPIFFGMMLGDVAYGVVLLGLMLYLRHRFASRATMRSLTEVLIMGSVWGIIFGFVYGEFFGELGSEIGLRPLFDRGHEVTTLFLITIAIGAAHVVLGLILGLQGALHRHNRHLAIEKVAMLVTLAGLFLLVAVVAQLLPKGFMTPAVAVLLVGMAILIYSLGGLGLLLGPLEVLGTVGNILSYLRIAAIGLSSVYLARVANELGATAAQFSVVIGILIAILFHTLNLALGAFSPTIHSLRLHYVEFFGKFYEGGGHDFHPLRRTLVYNERLVDELGNDSAGRRIA
jgi:V/A-type H+/Na+-transporting ATPase subunit I